MQQPFSDNLNTIADSMGIALYQRFTMNEASLFLRCPEADIRKLLRQGKIDHIRVTDKQAEFFGYQLLGYLLGNVTGEIPPPMPQSSPERILRSREVQEMTGLSRTSIWREERKGRFPARVPLTAGSVGWRLSEVEEWMKNRWTARRVEKLMAEMMADRWKIKAQKHITHWYIKIKYF